MVLANALKLRLARLLPLRRRFQRASRLGPGQRFLCCDLRGGRRRSHRALLNRLLLRGRQLRRRNRFRGRCGRDLDRRRLRGRCGRFLAIGSGGSPTCAASIALGTETYCVKCTGRRSAVPEAVAI